MLQAEVCYNSNLKMTYLKYFLLWIILISSVITFPPSTSKLIPVCAFAQWPLQSPKLAWCVALLTPRGERSKLCKPAPHTGFLLELSCGFANTLNTSHIHTRKHKGVRNELSSYKNNKPVTSPTGVGSTDTLEEVQEACTDTQAGHHQVTVNDYTIQT